MRQPRERYKEVRIAQNNDNILHYKTKLKELSIKFWKDIKNIRKLTQDYTISELENAKKVDWWWLIKEISISR